MIKIDGDCVGTRIGRAPFIRRPAIALSIRSETLSNFITAAKGVNEELYKLDQGASFPVDLIYFGGDEFLVTLPDYFSEAFLRGFNEGLEDTIFTYAKVIMPDNNLSAVQKKELKQLAPSYVGPLLEWAKGYAKKDTQRKEQGTEQINNVKVSATFTPSTPAFSSLSSHLRGAEMELRIREIGIPQDILS